MVNFENKKNRFTLVIEDIEDEMARGKCFGNINVGDEVYIIDVNNKIVFSKIKALKVADEWVSKAKDETVNLSLQSDLPLEKFMVITSIKPQTTIDVETAVENPHLLALSLEFEKFSKNGIYLDLLVSAICHSHYLTPVILDDNNINFLSIEEKDSDIKMLPLYTDWLSLSLGGGLNPKDQKIKTMIVRLNDVIKIAANNDGMVINAFGPRSLTFSNDLLSKITEHKCYQEEFNNKNHNFKEILLRKNTKVNLKTTSDTLEVAFVKENMVIYARNNKLIKRIDLFEKYDDEKKVYLCVVDCLEEDSKEIFEGIYKAVFSYLKEIMLIEFITYNRAKFVYGLIGDKTMVYEREDYLEKNKFLS